MLIGLASPSIATSLRDGLDKVARLQQVAASRGARIVCFPEAYLPGLRGLDFEVFPYDRDAQLTALEEVARSSRDHGIATIIGMERVTDGGRQIVSYVFDRNGREIGFQAKTQLDPSEDAHYIAASSRRMFELEGLRFGIAICHEGWRYPETVRWAAARGAHVVFHPQHTGSMRDGVRLSVWGAADGPYYEQAMRMRSRENTIYFASVNYALPFQESATSLIGPDGDCEAYLPYGEEGVLIAELDPERATGLLARRFAPERY